MITVGIDLAAQPERTAACRIDWSGGAAEVLELVPRGVGDDHLVELIEGADKAGLDVPLGWPDAFVAAVTAHHGSQPWPAADTTELRLRATDRWVAEHTGRWPLSVSTDRIGVPAFRAALLLSRCEFAIDRSGAGRVVEVYPAAALRRWGFDGQRYKRVAGARAREALVSEFRARTGGWLRMDEASWADCCASDDAFDALISALIARAAATELTEACPPEHAASAAREGWIAIPLEGSLGRLA